MEEYKISSSPSNKDFMRFTAYISKDLCIKKAINSTCATIVAGIAAYLFITTLSEIPSSIKTEYIKPLGKSGLFAIAFLAFIIIYTMLGKLLLKYNKIELTAPNGNLCRPKKTTISKDGLTETNDHHTSHTKWEGILKIEETDDLIIFFVDLYSAYYIPKHAFDNSEDAKNFLQRAESFYLQANKKNPWTKKTIENIPEEKNAQ